MKTKIVIKRTIVRVIPKTIVIKRLVTIVITISIITSTIVIAVIPTIANLSLSVVGEGEVNENSSP